MGATFGLGLWPPFESAGAAATSPTSPTSPRVASGGPGVFGLALWPPFDFRPQAGEPEEDTSGYPADLAEAIARRFEAAARTTLAGFTKLYENQAGDRATLPYLVYQIQTSPAYYTSSSSYWRDDRVMFKAYAGTQGQANTIRDAVQAAYGTGDYPLRRGFSIPFFQVNQSEGKEPNRTQGAGYVFRAEIHYSARVRRD